jgi:hypothetical protein
MDVTDPAGVSVNGGEFALGFDPTQVRISNVRTGPMLPGFTTTARIDDAAGVLVIDQSGPDTSFAQGADGAVLLFDVTVRPGASGDVVLNLLADAGPARTELSGPAGELTLVPAPTNAPTDPGDATVHILPPGHGPNLGPGPAPTAGPATPVRVRGEESGTSHGPGEPPMWFPPDAVSDEAPRRHHQ